MGTHHFIGGTIRAMPGMKRMLTKSPEGDDTTAGDDDQEEAPSPPRRNQNERNARACLAS